jgi:hypothetical protein
MFSSFAKTLIFLRARWRWTRGRCPLCTRRVYMPFAYYVADYPNCPVCQGENEVDLRMWHKYRALAAV